MMRSGRRVMLLMTTIMASSSAFCPVKPGALARVAVRAAMGQQVSTPSTTTRLFATKEKEEEKGGGHSVPGGQPEIDPELKAMQEKLMEHQKTAAKLTGAEEARTLVYYNPGYGVISTKSKSMDGWPASAMVGYAVDDIGRPIFSFSSISTHKHDMQADPRVSFMVAYKDFKGLDDGRVSLVGEAVPVPKEEVAAAREIYLKKHPGHFWVDFGDFDFFRMEKIVAVRYNGGFARFGNIEAEDYLACKPDFVGEFAAPVMKHMNDDHSDATAAMVRHYVGIPADKATIVNIDRKGMFVKFENKWGSSKIRVPFPREVVDRKDLKTIFVEMTQAASSA